MTNPRGQRLGLSGIDVRTRLFILVWLVLLPVLVFAGFLIKERFDHRSDAEIKASIELAEATASSFLNYVDKLWASQHAIGMAIAHGVNGHSADEIRRFMDAHLPYQSTVHEYLWVSPEGMVVASTSTRHEGESLAGMEYVRLIEQGQDRVISDIYPGGLGLSPALVAAVGVRTERALHGILVASIDVGRMQEVFHSGRSGESLIGLVDKAGRVVFRSNISNIPFEDRLLRNPGPALHALERQSTVVNYRFLSSIDDLERMGAAVFIPVIGWAAYVVAPIHEVHALARQTMRRDLTILLIITSLGFFLGFFWSNTFLYPLRALESAARAVARGELSTRAHVRGSDELAATAVAFNAMAEQLEEMETDRSRFIRATAHEIRNPLASLKAILQLLRHYVVAKRPHEDLLRTIARGEREADRANRLLSQLGDVMQIQAGSFHVERRPVDIVRIVNDALVPFQASIETGQDAHRLVLDLLSGPLHVTGDDFRIEQVVANLVANAVKYSPGGTEIRVSLRAGEHEAVLTVSDGGPGIPQDEIDKVFESYFRGKDAEGSEGMGLGLYICREIVSRINGSIQVRSSPMGGALFIVRLPLAPADFNDADDYQESRGN